MTNKQHALNALETARKMLDSPDEISGLRRAQLRGTLEFATECVEQIAELKRPRRAKPLAEQPPREEAP